MKIDFEKMKERTGCDFTKNGKYKKQDLLFYIKSILYNLWTHNKNYTKEQYYRIDELKEIFDCIEF